MDEVRRALLGLAGDEARFSLLNSRVILRTGLNLSDIKPTQRHDVVAIAKVMSALKEMGYDLSNQGGDR